MNFVLLPSILLLSLWLSAIDAKISDHFKPAIGKSSHHSMQNIDFIYIINLDPRPEKFAKCKEQLSLYGIHPYRFSAVNGWDLPLEAMSDVGVPLQPWMSREAWGTYYEGDMTPKHEPVQILGRVYFCHCMSRGAIGISLSHLSILQDAYDSGYETIWVMEDDIDVIQDPHILSDRIEELDELFGKEGWDVFFTDPDTKNTRGEYVPSFGFAWRPNYTPENPHQFAVRTDVSPNIKKIGSRFGAYSMIVRRSGMKKILDFLKQYHIFLPYDIDFVFPNGIQLFSARTDIVSTQPGAPSDNGAPNYERK
jgi:GR25 family glycosyltransferase involved in LPS biosynthesis